jgi:hypothetical protein
MMFLLPSEPLNTSKVDSNFQKEFEALTKMDFKVFLYDHDQFVAYKQLISNIDFSLSGELCLRTWMLKENQYHDLWTILHRNKINLINTPEQYLNCHYYPNVYKHIEKFAPKSIWFNSVDPLSVDVCRKLIDSDIIIKDFVKSEKGDDDIFYLQKNLSPEEFYERVVKFKESRGKLFNEGIVFKQVVSLRKYGDKTNEWRLFIYNGKIVSVSQNSELGYGQQPSYDFLNDVIANIVSNFYTIDIAELEDGSWIILETGDGQVSGLSQSQSEYTFFSSFLNLKDHTK